MGVRSRSLPLRGVLFHQPAIRNETALGAHKFHKKANGEVCGGTIAVSALTSLAVQGELSWPSR
jgi:hypothetical protein